MAARFNDSKIAWATESSTSSAAKTSIISGCETVTSSGLAESESFCSEATSLPSSPSSITSSGLAESESSCSEATSLPSSPSSITSPELTESESSCSETTSLPWSPSFAWELPDGELEHPKSSRQVRITGPRRLPNRKPKRFSKPNIFMTLEELLSETPIPSLHEAREPTLGFLRPSESALKRLQHDRSNASQISRNQKFPTLNDPSLDSQD